jgi:type I restriction enzyme S subunit
VCKLAEIASLKGGKMLDKASFLENGEHPVFGGAGVMGYSNLSNAEGFVITVGRVGAYCGQYFWHQGKAWVNNNASLVSPLNPDHSCWLFLWLKSVDMELIKKGAAQPFVSNGDISVLKIVLPPNQAIEKFIESADPIFQRLSSITTQIKSLESLRETLLPRLISGQLRVNEATEAIQ